MAPSRSTYAVQERTLPRHILHTTADGQATQVERIHTYSVAERAESVRQRTLRSLVCSFIHPSRRLLSAMLYVLRTYYVDDAKSCCRRPSVRPQSLTRSPVLMRAVLAPRSTGRPLRRRTRRSLAQLSCLLNDEGSTAATANGLEICFAPMKNFERSKLVVRRGHRRVFVLFSAPLKVNNCS